MQRWQDGLYGGGWNSLDLGNHNQPRPVSRWGDDGRWRVRSAKMLAAWLHAQQDTPNVYPGEELGKTDTPFARIEDGRDIEAINRYRTAPGRGQQPAEVMPPIRANGLDNARNRCLAVPAHQRARIRQPRRLHHRHARAGTQPQL